MRLFQIDLATVVSKYIGETEKNLSIIFREAESSQSLLFFDEADALYGKRTDVKDAHDRYANIEVNYLLQRMASYGGLAILATNMKSALDPAFLRRLRFVVSFPFPGVPERKARVLHMVGQMDREGFGNCTNYFECEAACPKQISVEFIARMNREYLAAEVKGGV